MASTTQSHGAPGPGPPDCHVGAANSAVATAVAVAWTRRTTTPLLSRRAPVLLPHSLSLAIATRARARQPATEPSAYDDARHIALGSPRDAVIRSQSTQPFRPFLPPGRAPYTAYSTHCIGIIDHPIRIATGQQLTPGRGHRAPVTGRGPRSTPRRHRSVPPLRPLSESEPAVVRRGRARRRSVSPPAMPAAAVALAGHMLAIARLRVTDDPTIVRQCVRVTRSTDCALLAAPLSRGVRSGAGSNHQLASWI